MSGRRSRISVRPNLARPGARTEAKVEKTDSSTAANAQQSADGNEPQESNNAKPAVATRRSRISVKPNIASKPVMPKEQPDATTTPASNSPAQSAAVLTRVARCATRASFNKESSEETLPATSENVIAVQEAEETTSQEASTSNSDTSVVSKGLVTNSHAQPPSKAGTRSTGAETVTPGEAANKELCASTNESSALSCDNVDNRRPALTARRARVSARPNLVPKVTQPVVQKKITGRQGSNARPAEAETPPLAPSQNADQARNTEREPQVSSAEVVIPPSRAAATFVVPSSLHIPSAGSVEQHSATADASHATCESQQSKLADEHGKMDRMAAVRSRHKFRPNLLEAARARKRHLSASCSESETEDVLGRQPPSTQRTTGLTLSIPSPSQVGRDEHAVANRVATPSTPQPSATPSSSEQSTHTARERRTSVLDIESEKEKLVVMKRRQRHRWTAKKPPDKSNMTMMDLIYWNPKNNCMPSRDKSPSRSTAASTQGSEISQPSNVPIEGDTAQAEVKDDEEEDVLVPQVKLGPDGSIILNEDSLVIDTSLKKDAQEKEVVYEDARDTYTTYGSFSKRTCSRAWSDKDTAKFFKALSTVGTDFSMMGSLFPNRKRIELKNKFKREERVNKTKVDKAIRDKQSFDLSVFDKSDTEDEEVATKKPIKKEKKQQRARKKTENNEGGATKPAKKSKRKNRRGQLSYEESDSDDQLDVDAVEADAEDVENNAENAEEEAAEQDEEDEEEEEYLSNLTERVTRAGRQPKRVRVYQAEEAVRKRRGRPRKQPDDDTPVTEAPPARRPSPTRPLPSIDRILQRSDTRPRLNIAAAAALEAKGGGGSPNAAGASGLSSPASPRVLLGDSAGPLSPGQLVFVRGESDDPKSKVIHVYMVSPPPGGTHSGGMKSPPPLIKSPPHPGVRASPASAILQSLRSPPRLASPPPSTIGVPPPLRLVPSGLTHSGALTSGLAQPRPDRGRRAGVDVGDVTSGSDTDTAIEALNMNNFATRDIVMQMREDERGGGGGGAVISEAVIEEVVNEMQVE